MSLCAYEEGSTMSKRKARSLFAAALIALSFLPYFM